LVGLACLVQADGQARTSRASWTESGDAGVGDEIGRPRQAEEDDEEASSSASSGGGEAPCFPFASSLIGRRLSRTCIRGGVHGSGTA
jgi:hypothetical protein